MTTIDPAVIMDPVRGYLPDTLVYRLAEALAASEAKVGRVQALAHDLGRVSNDPMEVDRWEVAYDIRAALADQSGAHS